MNEGLEWRGGTTHICMSFFHLYYYNIHFCRLIHLSTLGPTCELYKWRLLIVVNIWWLIWEQMWIKIGKITQTTTDPLRRKNDHFRNVRKLVFLKFSFAHVKPFEYRCFTLHKFLVQALTFYGKYNLRSRLLLQISLLWSTK